MRVRRIGRASSPLLRIMAGVASIAVILGLVLAPGLVRAQAGGKPEADLAEDPRLGFGVFVDAAPHVVVQRAKASVGTNFTITSSKANILTNMTFRLGGGVKGPAFAAVWGKPRPVLWAAALIPINESSTIGTKFVQTFTACCEQLEFSKYSIEYQTSAIAGFGLEFNVPIFDAMITVTPALESLHLVTRYVGEVSFEVNGTGINEDHALRTKSDITQHFIGPGLRIGAPTIVVKRVAIDFFLDVSVLFDVAGTRKEVTVDGQNGDRGTFSFESGSGVAQIGSGFQLRFP